MTDTIAFGGAAVLLLARIALFGTLHLRFPQLSPVRATVSDYGTGASRAMFTVMGLLTALAYLLFAAGLLVNGTDLGVSPWPLVGGVAAQALMLAFPTDVTGTGQRTTTGIVHWALAITQFALVFIFVTNASVAGAAWVDVLTWAVRIALYGFVVVLIVPPLRTRMVGLWERAFLVAAPLWFLVVSVVLMVR